MTNEERAAVEALRGCLENLGELIADLFRLQQRGNPTPDELLSMVSCLDSTADVMALALKELQSSAAI